METCSNLQLEPHPVSGEIELFGDEDDEEAGKIRYKRLDMETLQARCNVREHRIGVVWVWCENDTGSVGLPGDGESAEPQSGWRVAEVLPLDEEDEEDAVTSKSQWYNSVGEAEEAFAATTSTRSLSPRTSRNTSYGAAGPPGFHNVTPGAISNVSGDDDDYWASYDQSPSRTPQKSPAPTTTANAGNGDASNVYNPSRHRQPSMQLEADYYARYGSVQPAMDAHDPDEEEGTAGLESTLNHTDQERREQPSSLSDVNRANGQYHFAQRDQVSSASNHVHEHDNEPPITTAAQGIRRIHSPVPSRPSSSASGRRSPIETLEASASSTSAAEMGVKQHISTELKSLYRLARAAGIERGEFERVVRTELDVLGMMDM